MYSLEFKSKISTKILSNYWLCEARKKNCSHFTFPQYRVNNNQNERNCFSLISFPFSSLFLFVRHSRIVDSRLFVVVVVEREGKCCTLANRNWREREGVKRNKLKPRSEITFRSSSRSSAERNKRKLIHNEINWVWLNEIWKIKEEESENEKSKKLLLFFKSRAKDVETKKGMILKPLTSISSHSVPTVRKKHFLLLLIIEKSRQQRHLFTAVNQPSINRNSFCVRNPICVLNRHNCH